MPTPSPTPAVAIKEPATFGSSDEDVGEPGGEAQCVLYFGTSSALRGLDRVGLIPDELSDAEVLAVPPHMWDRNSDASDYTECTGRLLWMCGV